MVPPPGSSDHTARSTLTDACLPLCVSCHVMNDVPWPGTVMLGSVATVCLSFLQVHTDFSFLGARGLADEFHVLSHLMFPVASQEG